MVSRNLKVTLGKALLLASLLPRRPLEFYDRLLTFGEVRLEKLWAQSSTYPCQISRWHEVITEMGQCLKGEAETILSEPALAEIEQNVQERIFEIRSEAPFTMIHNADFTLARLCYCACRMLKPSVVLETGVAYGVTTAFILKALEANGNGVLHSVDLPPLGRNADRFVGILVLEHLKARWRLHRGVSKRVLPKLLSRLGKVDIFVHDSLHTYKNMLREFQIVKSYLSSPAVVIVDDVDSNQAFSEYVSEMQPKFWAVLHEIEKRSLFGISVHV